MSFIAMFVIYRILIRHLFDPESIHLQKLLLNHLRDVISNSAILFNQQGSKLDFEKQTY